jgi:SH3-like domain-containing protein
MRRGMSAAMIAASATLFLTAASADTPTLGPDSNLPVPRLVSLRVEGAHGRHGPGLDHRVDWIYQRAGLPLRVTAESGPWRRVVDPDGAEVWMHAQNLDPRRTAYVTRESALRRQARDSAQPVAYVRPGVVGALTGCDGQWRRFAVGGRVGWVEESALWGAADCSGL